MELKDFIAKTLSDIAVGINDGNDLMQKHNHSYAGSGPIDISFDVSVSYDEKENKNGEVKITVISLLSGKLTKGSEIANSNFSRIKFSVRMGFKTERTKVI